jgi:hypothetical protein
LRTASVSPQRVVGMIDMARIGLSLPVTGG